MKSDETGQTLLILRSRARALAREPSAHTKNCPGFPLALSSYTAGSREIIWFFSILKFDAR